MTDYFLYDETVKKKRHKKKVLITWLMIMIAVNIAIFGYLYYVTYVDRGYVSVNFIDVKQGDSSFINTPKGNHILIDGGDVSFGKGAVKQFMVSRGIHDLDVAFVTHCHEDHATGIIELIESGFSIKKVCVHGSGDHNDLGKRLLKVASEHGVEVEFLKVGDVLEFDDVTMTILAPENMFIEKGKVDENESSLVIRMDYAKNSVLFTGEKIRRKKAC
ncbi:MAG: MBL fold metallo-hydrolase [Oscillospiraceae bacterium]